MNTKNTLGIDFGTSNSAAGVLIDEKPHLIEIEAGQKTLPTSIFFDFETKEVVFGNTANTALIEGYEGRFMRSLKSVLGTSLMHEKRVILGQSLSFVDIISLFLTKVKTSAEKTCGQSFDCALSGRPVHFHSNDAAKNKQALIDLTECYHRAGFKHVDFMFEPEAAAVANGALDDDTGLGLIVDIGGGTSDFSLFKNNNGSIKVIASHGVRVGGTNFDKSINVDHVMPLLGKDTEIRNELGAGTLPAPNGIFHDLATWEKIPFLYSHETRIDVAHMSKLAVEKSLFSRFETVLEYELAHEIAFAVEAGKIRVNKDQSMTSNVNLDFVEPKLSSTIDNADIQHSLTAHAQKIKICALETLALGSCSADKVNTVVFVGGSSLMTIVEDAMVEIFPTAELKYSNAFTAVVDGLAITAGKEISKHH